MSIIDVRITAAAYALSFTSGIGDESWKKIARGKVAVGWFSAVGMLSVKPVVNKTAAASPMARPNDNKTAVTMPGIHWRNIILKASSDFVDPNE